MKRHLTKLTLAIVVALVATLGFAGIALANPIDTRLGITKEIVLDNGVVVPASSFTFTFTQMMPIGTAPNVQMIPISGTGVPANDVTPVTIPSQTISFPADQIGPDANIAQLGGNSPTAGLDLATITWPHAGQFFFMLQETAGTNGFNGPENFMNYDDIAYLIIVSVANTPTGPAISEIQAAVFLPPTYTPNPGGGPGTWSDGTWNTDADGKLYFTPGYYTPDPGGGPGTWVTDLSELRFENEFSRQIITTIENPALAISKTITGDYANLLLDFDFSARLVIPQSALDRDTPFEGPVTATVVDTSGPTNVAVNPPRTVTFTGTMPNLSADFTLGHNEALAFINIPAGTTFNVTEYAAENYLPTVVVTSNHVSRTVTGTTNTDLNTGAPESISDRLVDGRFGNSAAFTNAHQHVPITGLDLASMPFVLALGIATMLLAMMVASRSRQRIESLPIAY
jgi:hypothetical protein